MRLAEVVPRRRMVTGPGRFDYIWPDSKPIIPGVLVQIPFGRASVEGVVWRSAQAQPKLSSAYRPIQGIISDRPVMSERQMQLLERIAEVYDVPLANLVQNALPDRLESVTVAAGSKTLTGLNKSRVLWYTRRSSIETYLTEWLQQPGPRLLLVPTIQDVMAWAKRLPRVIPVHGRLTPRTYRDAYLRVAADRDVQVVGTSKALWLPWSRLPQILLDQEEHVGYRQTKARPVFRVPRLLERLRLPYTRSTAAPQLRTYQRLSIRPRAPIGRRVVAELGRPGQSTWVTDELRQTLEEWSGDVFFVFPRRGYAGSLMCGECGLIVRCPNCQRAIRLWRHDATHSRCRACQHLLQLPTRCPRCHGHDWKYTGVGVERWPDILTAASLPYRRKYTSLTYLALNQLPVLDRPRLVVIPTADALLASSDYAATEQAWQYLARLASRGRPDDRILVQTFEPGNVFWQRWLHGQTRAMYDSLLQDRRKHRLPPFANEWIATWPKAKSDQAVQRAQITLRRTSPGIALQPLVGGPTGSSRWRVTEKQPGGLDHLRPSKLFPPPWRVDIDSDTWVP